MKAEQTVLARITPAGMVLAPVIMLGMVGLLWLLPFMYGSYERFFVESRHAAGWPVITPLLTLATLGLVAVFTAQRIRHGRAIVLMGQETVTLVGFSVKTVRLIDVVDAGRASQLFTVRTVDGKTHSLGAGFWDTPPEIVADTVLTAARGMAESRGVGQTTV